MARLAVIRELAALDLPLSLMRALAHARLDNETGDEAAREVAEHLESLWREVEAKMRAARAMMDRVALLQRLVQRCFGCRRPPRAEVCAKCPTSDALLAQDLTRLIWDKAGDGRGPP